jgi:membrane-bound lytic murein transglycosylase B
MFKRKFWVGFACLLVVSGVTTAVGSESKKTLSSNVSDDLSADTNPHEKLSELIKYLQEEGFDINPLLEDPRFEIYEDIADRFTKSAERKSHSLDSYKRVLGFDHKSNQIAEFIDTHSDQLQKAEQKYGISKYVIAAILGIESDFGKNVGNYNPFNAYASMYANNYRQDFAKAQIEELLKFVERNNIDVFELKSSYAGAMAFAQFIPYSLNKWFVGKDIFDMNNNIMSIGNYLAYFKERTGNIETAVLRYNPSDLYTQAVLDLANTAEHRFPKAK